MICGSITYVDIKLSPLVVQFSHYTTRQEFPGSFPNTVFEIIKSPIPSVHMQ
jgi:hypothetical protein